VFVWISLPAVPRCGVTCWSAPDAFKKPVDAKVKVIADTTEAEKSLASLAENKVVKVTAELWTREGKKVG